MSALLLALLAPASAGVIIGNPPQVRTLVGTTDRSADALYAEVAGTELEGCGGDVATLVHFEPIELVGGWAPLLPPGEWCTLTVTFVGPPLRCDAEGCGATPVGDLALEGPAGLTVEWVVLPGPIASGW